MDTFKARFAGLLGHVGEQMAGFVRDEFSRAVAHAILPREAAHDPSLAVLMAVNDHINYDDDSPLNCGLREFVAATLIDVVMGKVDEDESPAMANAHEIMRDHTYSTISEVVSKECADSPMANELRAFVARTVADILNGEVGDRDDVACHDSDARHAYDSFIMAMNDARQSTDHIRAIVREELAKERLGK